MGRPKGSKNKKVASEPKPVKLTNKAKRELLEIALFDLISNASEFFRSQNELNSERKTQQEFLRKQTEEFFERNKAKIDEQVIKAGVDSAQELKEKQSQEPPNATDQTGTAETVEPANLAAIFKPASSDSK